MLSTFARGLQVVELLAESPRSARRVAEDLSLPRQSAYRILATLCSAGWVARKEEGDTYYLLTRVWSIGAKAAAVRDPQAAWAKAASVLADTTGETALVAVYERGAAVYVVCSEGWQPVRTYTALGARSPAYCVATGKALLSYQSSGEVDAVVAAGLIAFTPKTITTPEGFARELARTRENGFAVNAGEYQEDVGGVALPVFSVDGQVVAAIGISGPVTRIDDRVDEIRARIQECIHDYVDSGSAAHRDHSQRSGGTREQATE